MRVPAVTRADIDGLCTMSPKARRPARSKTKKRRGLTNVRGGKGTASRTVGLLGSIFTYAVRHGMRPDNPVRGVERFADGQRKRRLTDEEYASHRCGSSKAEKNNEIWRPAIALTRFLLLTGWSRGEALALKACEVDLARRTATLGDSRRDALSAPLHSSH